MGDKKGTYLALKEVIWVIIAAITAIKNVQKTPILLTSLFTDQQKKANLKKLQAL